MRALIIEDSPDYLRLLERFLSRELAGVDVVGYVPARHGGAVPDLADDDVDVILLDYKLGEGVDGLAWLRALRAQEKCPPVVFMTAEGDEYVAARAIKLGATDYVNKRDLTSKRLADLIRGALVQRAELDWALGEGDGEAAQAEAGESLPEADATLSDDAAPLDQQAEEGYRFLRPIGAGSMSKVYLAERVRDHLSLALKVISLRNLPTEETKKRFLREAELASSVDSPHVVKVYDFGFTPAYGFIAMELFTRGDLKQRLARGVTVDEAAVYLWNIAQGLRVIHRVGILHRDLKPDNIMFRSDDSMAIADFGISKRLVEPTLMTTLGKVLGTPSYMSPEQGQGEPMDARSDLYALGVIFHEMLTGRAPYEAPNALSVIQMHVAAPIPRLTGPAARYQAILDRLLAKDPNDRFPSARAVGAAVREFIPTVR